MTMNWFTRSRQRCLGLLAVVALLLAFALAACGSPANTSNSGAPASNSGTPVNTRPQQYQPSNSGSTTQNTGSTSGVKNTDQQIQDLLRQLDGAQNDASNADAGTSQDGGQP
jgi:hypothetical protein